MLKTQLDFTFMQANFKIFVWIYCMQTIVYNTIYQFLLHYKYHTDITIVFVPIYLVVDHEKPHKDHRGILPMTLVIHTHDECSFTYGDSHVDSMRNILTLSPRFI